jgi:hypothetical protein
MNFVFFKDDDTTEDEVSLEACREGPKQQEEEDPERKLLAKVGTSLCSAQRNELCHYHILDRRGRREVKAKLSNDF